MKNRKQRTTPLPRPPVDFITMVDFYLNFKNNELVCFRFVWKLLNYFYSRVFREDIKQTAHMIYILSLNAALISAASCCGHVGLRLNLEDL